MFVTAMKVAAATQESVLGMILPVTLGLLLVAMYLHQALTETAGANGAMSEFLALTLLQVLPLILIKMGTLKCIDRTSLLSRFTTKVLLMHVLFLTLRISFFPFAEIVDWNFYGLVVDSIACVVACGLLFCKFDFSLRMAVVSEHGDLLVLLFLALFGSIVVNLSRPPKFRRFVPCALNNVETLAFMPAVLMLYYQMDRRVEVFAPMPEKSARSQANSFLTFVVLYYLHDDIWVPSTSGLDAPLFYAAHIVHFIMLLDHGAFFLFQAYATSKAKAESVRLPGTTESGAED